MRERERRREGEFVLVYIIRKESRVYLRACMDGKKYCGEKKVRLEKRGRNTSKSCEEIKSSRKIHMVVQE